MSSAGVFSNRGDYYQILVALHWLIKMLENKDGIKAIQVDSVGLPDNSGYVGIDDVVVCYDNESYRFIQAKKNQPNHTKWSFSDLKDELEKSIKTFNDFPDSTIEFCSRTPFGELQKLKEACSLYREYPIFRENSHDLNIKLLKKLADKVKFGEKETFQFVLSLEFGSAHSINDWESTIKIRLSSLFVKSDEVCLLLEKKITEHESALIGSKSTISREDLLSSLEEKGFYLAPYQDLEMIINEFKEVSKIGRNWSREIAGTKIPVPSNDRLMGLLRDKTKTILVQGGPGSGKSCVLLDTAEAVERDPSFVLLFIKADLFAEVASEQDLFAQGIPEDIPGKCSFLSKSKKVVVILDSLDVLSLNRDHRSLVFFLKLMDQLQNIDNIVVVASCREFDLKYDVNLRDRKWDERVLLNNWDFDSQVSPVLEGIGVNCDEVDEKTKKVLCVPQMLKMYTVLVQNGVIPEDAFYPYELFNFFVNKLIEEKSSLGQVVLEALQSMAFSLLKIRANGYSRNQFPCKDKIGTLCSLGVLHSPRVNRLEFGHQILLESFSIQKAIQEGMDLNDFIVKWAPLPFIRPSVRAFLFYIRANQSEQFSRQVLKVLKNPEVAYHLKRLIVESLAEIFPEDSDRSLIRKITENYPDLFIRFLWRTQSSEWFFFLRDHWLPYFKECENESLVANFYMHLEIWQNDCTSDVLSLWLEALESGRSFVPQVSSSIIMTLKNFERWDSPLVRKIILYFMKNGSESELDILGDPLSCFVQCTNSGDDLLWSWITRKVASESGGYSWNIIGNLDCKEYDFCSKTFLKERLANSEVLLGLVIKSISEWGKNISISLWHEGATELTESLKYALMKHSSNNTVWWQKNKILLANSSQIILKSFLIEACKENIECNIDVIRLLLLNDDLWIGAKLDYDLGRLMNLSFPLLDEEDQKNTQMSLLKIPKNFKDEESDWRWKNTCCDLSWIPACYRLQETQSVIDKYKSELFFREARVSSSGGWVCPPFSANDLLQFSDSGVIKILEYYNDFKNGDFSVKGPVGGTEAVSGVLQEAAALEPSRLLRLLPEVEGKFNKQPFAEKILAGVANYLLYKWGDLQAPQGWSPHVEEEGFVVGQKILMELEERANFWRGKREAANAIKACSYVVKEDVDVECLISLMASFIDIRDPEIGDDLKDLITTAINSARGVVAESTMILANRLLEEEREVSESLYSVIQNFATDRHPAVRAALLRRLPFFLYKKTSMGWNIISLSLDERDSCLWPHVESCLYYQYRDNYNEVKKWLRRWQEEGLGSAGDGLGRIACLCYLSGYIPREKLIKMFDSINDVSAWKGAIEVFCANFSNHDTCKICKNGLSEILDHIDMSDEIWNSFKDLFLNKKNYSYIKSNFVIDLLEKLKCSDLKNIRLDSSFFYWFAFFAEKNPEEALCVGEALFLLIKIKTDKNNRYYGDSLSTALVEILKEADESDDPDFIRRAVDLQDGFLKLNIYGIENILASACS